MGHKTQDTLFLVGGAMLGAAALYLLDPSAGQRRRRRLAAAAEDALETARHSVGAGWDNAAASARDIARHVHDESAGWQDSANASGHHLADGARGIAHQLSERAQAHGAYLRDLGSRAWHRARNWGAKVAHLPASMAHLPASIAHEASHVHDQIADSAHHLGDWWSGRAKDARRRTGSWLGYKDGFGTATVTSTAVGCIAVGAGLMYFLDPNRGHARRAWIGQKTASVVRDTGRTMRSVGRDLGNRFRGLVYGARSGAENMVGGLRRVDSEILVQRIRAEMGHLSPHFNLLQLMADADGTVTLTGAIARHEVDGLLTMLHRIPGVTHVINRMNASEMSESMKPSATMSASR